MRAEKKSSHSCVLEVSIDQTNAKATRLRQFTPQLTVFSFDATCKAFLKKSESKMLPTIRFVDQLPRCTAYQTDLDLLERNEWLNDNCVNFT
jgi:hypothetical protein